MAKVVDPQLKFHTRRPLVPLDDPKRRRMYVDRGFVSYRREFSFFAAWTPEGNRAYSEGYFLDLIKPHPEGQRRIDIYRELLEDPHLGSEIKENLFDNLFYDAPELKEKYLPEWNKMMKKLVKHEKRLGLI